jgi:AraC family transcriptional activator of pyochelin receptor
VAERNVDIIAVSPEMVTILGDARPEPGDLPANSATLLIALHGPASVCIFADAARDDWSGHCDDRTIALVVTRDALARLFDWSPVDHDGEEYFLDAGMAGIADQILESRHGAEAQTAYRLGKSIELLCELTVRLKAGKLTPAHRDLSLSQVDSQRLSTARAMIDEQWSQKLTLAQIARSCGLNRTKLSRGFRELYRCSVAEALADRRLAEARRQLLATDLPVSVIGYRTGYSNNASFSRAFGRRFGQSPSELRTGGGVS